jgi:hypothetical protein
VGTEKRERQKANRALRNQQEVQAAARRTMLRKVAIGVAGVVAVIVFVWIASAIVSDDDTPVTPATLPDTPDATVPTDTTPSATVPADTTDTTEG